MSDVATRTAEAIEALRHRGAVFGYLHGSRAAATARSGSDVDIAAHFGGQRPQAFEILLPPGVDLLVPDEAPLEFAGASCPAREASLRERSQRPRRVGSHDTQDLSR